MTDGERITGRLGSRGGVVLRRGCALALTVGVTTSLSGCFLIGGWEFKKPQPEQATAQASESARGLSGQGVTVASLDKTTAAEKRAAASAGGGTRIGSTVASLGDPTVQGFWVRTPLVSAPAKGRLANPKTGASVAVDLEPLAAEKGAGSQVSLAAMRALGANLTDLPHLDVYRN